MICKNCKQEVPEGYYCDLCGAAVKMETENKTRNFGNRDEDRNETVAVSNRESELIILREISRGGMSVIKEAYYKSNPNFKFALKVFKEEINLGTKELEKIYKKINILKKFDHKNIVKIYDLYIIGGKINMAMELVKGKDLYKIISEKGSFDISQTAYICVSLCNALIYSHSKNIIHRDIKPSNVMIDEENNVKLTDFDIAFEIKNTVTALTGKDFFGTPLYMAYEQHLGRHSFKTDIYSLGVLSYELLTGEPPFKGSGMDIIYQKEKKSYIPLKEAVGDLSLEICEIIDKCLEPNPDLRPSLEEVKNVFKLYQKNNLR